MKRIFVCSPLRGDGSIEARIANQQRAAGYCRAVLSVGYIPVAGHLFYPQFLDDADPDERAMGIALGQFDMASCHELWHWGDADWSTGMRGDIRTARRYGLGIFDGIERIEERRAEIASLNATILLEGDRPFHLDPARVRISHLAARKIRNAYPLRASSSR